MSAEQGADVWAPFRFFVGTWRGEETGRVGTGKGEREYEFVLREKFLFQRNKSVFEPQEGNPTGEVHEDLALFSYDEARKAFVLREFHAEGFVNQYVLGPTDGMRFVFVTESIENIPPGWRARLTLMIEGEDAFRETFELARPEKDFEPYLENRWTRVR